MHRFAAAASLLAPLVAMAMSPNASLAQDLGPWPQHSMDRPRPPVVDPGPPAALPTPPPADAIVLFDGTDLSKWRSADDSPAKWKVEDGAMVVAPGTGDIHTADAFGDVQLHVEWSAPVPAEGEGQDRGNSGVFLMSTYEVQVLDSYRNDTYPDGQAAAIFGEYPPLVNVTRPPGQWNSYDIIFHRPHFKADGSVASPARFTVFHNGVLVQDDVALVGPTTFGHHAPYTAHPDKLPLSLQDHHFAVRYRNIWIRPLHEEAKP